MLYLIGIGLGNEKDISLNALEVLKSCEYVYLECYTSNIGFDIRNLEKLIGKTVVLADRNLVESNSDILIENANDNNVAFLVKGDVFSATTHISLFLSAKEKRIDVKVLHNASILTAIGDTGLMLYKFGKVVSIPFHNSGVEIPYDILKENLILGAHTLFLLDLKSSNEFMNFKDALNYLLNLEMEKSNGIFTSDTNVVLCAALGTDNAIIKYGKVGALIKLDINVYPQSIIVPGKLHFIEEEILRVFKI